MSAIEDLRQEALNAVLNVTRAIGFLESAAKPSENIKRVGELAIDDLAVILTYLQLQPFEEGEHDRSQD